MRGVKLARLNSVWTLLAVAAPVALLLVAAFMQYHLIEQVSHADLRHRREYTERALRNLTSEFHEEILSPLQVFRPLPAVRPDADVAKHLSALAAQWRQTSRRPGLLAAVGFAEQTKAGRAVYMSAPAASFAGGGEFREYEWPASLAVYRDILEHRLRTHAGEPPLFPNGFAFELDGESPVLVFPLVLAPRHLPARVGEEPPPPPPPPPPHAHEGGHRRPAPHDSTAMLRELREAPDGGFGRAHELKGWGFLTLDTKYLHGEFLHELVERHFGVGGESDYRVEVTAGPRVVYRSDPEPDSSPPEARTAADSTLVLFFPHVQPGMPPLPHPPHGAGGPVFARTREPFPPPFAHGPADAPVRMSGPPEAGGPGVWRLALSYKAGSLESLVAQARRRNLALGFGVLLLLAASTVALGLAARRARRLARQQMEFVAGVSHELRTPLTVIQSTSYNLSKGTVQDPARVRRYGAVIQEEARRLIAEVERMLSFAGVQSGRAVYDFRPLDVGEVVGRALAEFRPAFEEGGWTVEEDLAADLPPVSADARAIESAVKNLLENGLKYGAAGKTTGRASSPRTCRASSSPSTGAAPRTTRRRAAPGSASRSSARSSATTAGRSGSTTRRSWEGPASS